MKKIIIVLMLLLTFPLPVNAISAEAAIVMDADSGRVLFGKNIRREKLIASTTKIMTALVAIENIDLNRIAKVDDSILKSHGSAIYVQIGEKISMMDLLYGLMLRSGNDAAIIIANEVSGSMEKFVELMNKRAKSIGMKNTIFYNSHGLEEQDGRGNMSTVYDLALLTKTAMQNETFRIISGTKKWQAKTSDKTYVWQNKNRLLTSYEFATGGKTGFTERAKRTLVTTATKDNKNLIIVTLNDGNDFANHKALYEQYFNKYEKINILNPTTFVVNENEYYKSDRLVIRREFNMLLTKEEIPDVRKVVELERVKWPKDNQRVGVVKVYLKDMLMHEESIYYERKVEESVNKKSFWQRIWNFIKFWE